MAHATLPHRLAAGLVLLLSCSVAFANEVEQRLRSEYRGKILAERSFYSGEHLVYDSAGNLSSGGRVGDWTTDGFVQINDIRLSGQRLKIKATRLMVVSQGQRGLQFAGESGTKHKKPKKSAVVQIDITAAAGALNDEWANALWSKVFLTSQDSFADAVPIYWKPCIEAAVSRRKDNCGLSSELSVVPGMSTPSRNPTDPLDQFPSGNSKESDTPPPAGTLRVGNGVKPPRATYQPEPSFSEPARKARYQGVVTMALIVDKDGLPQKIHILNPLGGGLDAKAVEAVSTWKFHPAEKNGQPVAVQIAVEVDFHLY